MLEKYRASTKRDVLTIESEPHIVKGFRGFGLAVVARKEDDPSTEYLFQLDGIKSLAEGLEPLLKENEGSFAGLKFGIKKASSERVSQYVIDTKSGSKKNPTTNSSSSMEDVLWKKIEARYNSD